ncbi:MAG: hypothetical protein DMD94_22540 [Candidatus Rokuibacteriota bacterium]|nr:MAG: hypothetical protein DMD94_22540 [Candidatus Rokubacteria bacterium]
MKAVGNMVAAGVFERYPGLNLVLAEAGVGWIPFFAQEFDYYQMSFGPSPIGLGRQRDIPRPPSEYIYRQVYGAFIQDAAFGPARLDSSRRIWDTSRPRPEQRCCARMRLGSTTTASYRRPPTHRAA